MNKQVKPAANNKEELIESRGCQGIKRHLSSLPQRSPATSCEILFDKQSRLDLLDFVNLLPIMARMLVAAPQTLLVGCIPKSLFARGLEAFLNSL